jgi:hypothetical protein
LREPVEKQNRKIVRNKVNAAALMSPTVRFVSLLSAQDTICVPLASTMPDQGAGLTNTESHCGAAQSHRCINCEAALNCAALNCAALTMREKAKR